MDSGIRNRALGRGAAAAVLASTVAAAGFAWWFPADGRAGSAAAVMADPFCATAPADAHATPEDAANVSMNVAVPRTDPAIGEMAVASAIAAQGDVVRVSVASPREGGVAVHGLFDVRPIAAGGHVTIEFRAIYSGRFPIHFHGADGSHIEIAAFEVRPQSIASLK
jgi:hypothetical protein